MFLIILVVIVIVILFKMGVFRKPSKCQNCGKTLKGTEQRVFDGNIPFCLCKECADKIHPQILSYAKNNWSYTDYINYLTWEDATKEERAQFNPDVKYGLCELKIDTERGLFSIGLGMNGGLVFRFADLSDYELDFKPEKVDESFFGDTIRGDEFITVELTVPKVYIEEIIKPRVELCANKKGFLSSKYEYALSEEFTEIIRAFTLCIYIENEKRNGEYQRETMNIGEVEKALALFMFDSMDDVTQDSLKKQRNALIKAFHPDNDEQNDSYSQKINAAYDLLSGMAKQ